MLQTGRTVTKVTKYKNSELQDETCSVTAHCCDVVVSSTLLDNAYTQHHTTQQYNVFDKDQT